MQESKWYTPKEVDEISIAPYGAKRIMNLTGMSLQELDDVGPNELLTRRGIGWWSVVTLGTHLSNRGLIGWHFCDKNQEWKPGKA